MPVPYERHLFVCTNRRADDHARGCCGSKNSEELKAAFKAAAKERGLRGRVRAQASGCLDVCERGPTVVVYPEGVWYGGVTLKDVDEIVDEHLVHGRIVERLRFA